MARRIPSVNPGVLAWLFIAAYGGAGVAYYEKWYSSVRKSELVPYEATTATLRALVPAGPKYLYASPQFWTPFHAEPGTTFFSYAAAQPVDSGSTIALAGAGADRPIFLIVDEYQWLPELTGPTSSTPAWQRAWIAFIEQRCALDGVAPGTAHGTLALYECALSGPARAKGPATPRIIGGSTEYHLGDLVLSDRATELGRWARYDDPRRTTSARPEVRPTEEGLHITGTGWPGIVKMIPTVPGDSYLVRTATRQTRRR